MDRSASKTLKNLPKSCSKKSFNMFFNIISKWCECIKQDGRLPPASFSPEYKDFDQHLQTVKNKTTVLILVFKEFLQINSTTDFCTLCKMVSQFSLEKISRHSAEKFRRGTLLCFRKFLLSKDVRDKRGGGGIKIFRWKFFVSQCRKISWENPLVFH